MTGARKKIEENGFADLGQRPSEAGRAGRCHDENEAEGVEGGLASDHHDYADSHDGYDKYKAPRGLLEAEEEREYEDEAECGRLAHCWCR
jgi:hypothetical protein